MLTQEDNYDCGITCLLTIIRYYKSDASKDYLKEISNTTKEGTTMYGLIEASKKLGFKAVGKTGSVEKINKKSVPLIAHIKINEQKNLYHYVIISKITNKKIIIKDPSNKIKELKLEDFKKISTNNYLFIYKTAKTKIISNKKIIEKTIIEIIKKNRKLIIVGIVVLIINIILELLNLFSLKIILNNAITVEYKNNLKILIIVFLYLLILRTISNIIIKITNQKLITGSKYLLKTTLISHLLSLPYLYYKEKEKGTILSLFKDIDILSNYLFTSFFVIVYNTVLIIFIYSYFFTLSKYLSIILIISNIILILLIYIQNKISKKLISIYYKTEDNYNNHLNLIINNNEKIKGLHIENTLVKKMKNIINDNLVNNYKLDKYKNNLENFLSFFEGIVYLIIITIGGYIIITTNNLSLLTFLLLENLLFMSLKNIESLYLIIVQNENYKVIKERLNNVFYYKKENLLTNNKYNYDTKKITISIRNLSFKYYDNLILDNISLTINPKDKIFIYGESGSGKSTLVKLLGRYLPVEYNNIKINDIDITHYNLDSLRNMIKYITESDMLSNTTIKDNIYLSRKPKINQHQLIKISGLNKMLKEKNYNINTILEENGNNLSKGEKSRINLAQALFEPSEIYIFDECLSNIDIELEKEILKNIMNYYKDKIIIYISHRLTNKDLFNRTIYIEKGKCYEKNKL